MEQAAVIGGAVLVMKVALIILVILCYALFYKSLKRLYIRLISKKNTAGIFAVFFLTGFIFFLGFFALAGATAQMAKDKDKLFSKIAASPSNQAADELIAHIQQYGCENNPNAWNKLRSVWITINESPNVSTEKKKQLKQFLMLQGLTMHYQDAQIIDNCKL